MMNPSYGMNIGNVDSQKNKAFNMMGANMDIYSPQNNLNTFKMSKQTADQQQSSSNNSS